MDNGDGSHDSFEDEESIVDLSRYSVRWSTRAMTFSLALPHRSEVTATVQNHRHQLWHYQQSKKWIMRTVPVNLLNHGEMKTLEKRGVEVRVHQSVYDSIPFAKPFDADEAHSTGLTNDEDRNENAATKEENRQPMLDSHKVGKVMERTIHTASIIATDVTNTAFDVLDNMLEIPSLTPSIGGEVQPKDLEDKERKKKRRNR